MVKYSRLLTSKQVARLFVVDDTTVRRWAKEGKISFVTLPGSEGGKIVRRYRRTEVEEKLGELLPHAEEDEE